MRAVYPRGPRQGFFAPLNTRKPGKRSEVSPACTSQHSRPYRASNFRTPSWEREGEQPSPRLWNLHRTDWGEARVHPAFRPYPAQLACELFDQPDLENSQPQLVC